MSALRLATVDLSAIRANVGHLREVVGDAEVMAVVKANAYGHGAVPVARAALEGGASWLGVADLVEALELRDAGIEAPILAWLHDPSTVFDEPVRRGIDIGVSESSQLEAVAAAGSAVGRTPAVHLKVDTGLGRSGAGESAWDALFARAAELEREGILQVRGLFSHLSNANDLEDLAQTTRFHDAIARAEAAGLTPRLLHLASTAGAIRLPDTRFTLVRLGIGIYGLSPFEGVTSAELGLRPAMTLESRAVAVKRVPAGAGVSYGYTYRTGAESTLVLVGLGYADGVPRHGSNGAPVWIGGAKYRIAGRIAMDQFVVDLGGDSAQVGDRVVLFGDPEAGFPSADDWAVATSTINYEVVTRLGGRIERRYLP